MKHNPYKITVITLVVVFFAVMTWNGMPATLDKIAASRMPMPMKDINCIAAFNEQMEGLSLK